MIVIGQGFSYTITDPCTLKSKQIYIDNPNGSVTLFYNGQTQNFTPSQLQSGSFEQWINEVNATNPPGTGPCGGVGIEQNTTLNILVSSNNIAVLTNVMSTMSTITSMAGGSTIQGIVQSNEKVVSNGEKEEENNNSKTTNKESTQQETTSSETTQQKSTSSEGTTSSSETSQGSSSEETTTSSSETSQSGSGGGTTTSSNQSTKERSSEETISESEKKPDEEKLSEVKGSEVRSSTQVKAKVAAVKQGSLMMTGDIVVISNAASRQKQQVKVNMSIIKSNTKNTFAKGALLNYTTSINNTCFTLFGAYRKKGLTSIVANSTMINFQKDFFNTLSLMESYKYKSFTGTIGLNYTNGKLGKSKFSSISSLGGVVSNFNIGKKMNTTIMFVMVYSPYVYYYEGLWYKSGLLAVPFCAIDYKLTTKFKMNLSFSGVHQIKDATLNYQVLLGAKALL
jgi:hypothetical protein